MIIYYLINSLNISMSNIIITSGGRRVSLVKAFQKELKKIVPNGKVFVSDSFPMLSSAAQISDSFVKVPMVTDKNYIDKLLAICLENNIALVIPTIDTELLLLSRNREMFLKHNIDIVISDEYFIEICESKINTHSFFKDYKLDTAEVYSKTDYKLPLFIKPINGSNSVDNYIIHEENQITDYHINNEDLRFFEYLDHNLYDEYTCDLYYDRNSKLKCVIPRKRIEVRGGEVSKGVTRKNEIKKFIEEAFGFVKGVRGCIIFQVFMHKQTNKIKGIEINARFGGGFPLSYFAGGNFPKWIIQEYFSNKELTYFNDWQDNLLMLRFDGEVFVENYEE